MLKKRVELKQATKLTNKPAMRRLVFWSIQSSLNEESNEWIA